MLPKAEELAPSMAQAAQTKTARGRGIQDRISIPGRAVSLCHTAKGPAQGAFGLRWSPVPPSRAGTSNPKRVAFHSLNTFVKVWSGMSVAADFERRGLSYFRFGSDPKRPSFHDRTRTFLYTHLSGIGTLSFDRLPGVSEPVSQPLLISDVFGFQAYYIISPEAMQ